MRKLPVLRSVGEVFAGVTLHYFRLLWLAVPGLLLMFAALIVLGAFVASGSVVIPGVAMEATGAEADDADGWTWAAIALVAIIGLALLYAYGAMIVRWHRFVLTGETRTGWSAFFGRVNFNYMMTFIKMILILMIAAVVLSFFEQQLGGFIDRIRDAVGGSVYEPLGISAGDAAASAVRFLLVMLPLTLVIVRVVLALPDAAIGGKGSLEASIEATRGNTIRLILLLLAAGLAMQILDAAAMFAVEYVEMHFDPDSAWTALLYLVVSLPLYFYGIMLYFTSLSVAYREIVGLAGGHEGEATAAEPSPGL